MPAIRSQQSAIGNRQSAIIFDGSGRHMVTKALTRGAPLLMIVGLPSVAFAATGGEHGAVGPILFGLVLLVIAAKAGGRLAERMGQPPVLGELLAGIALGNLLPLVLWGG